MLMVLVATVLDGQCTTDGFDSYVGSEITILPMELTLTVLDAQCTTDGVGSYIGSRIATTSMIVSGSYK